MPGMLASLPDPADDGDSVMDDDGASQNPWGSGPSDPVDDGDSVMDAGSTSQNPWGMVTLSIYGTPLTLDSSSGYVRRCLYRGMQ
jgi:hypothetical protein